ncbi:hypothetical protein MKW98_003299 [Papaver atlanticum]|uniref:Uncharacterized protein n=1 Tax=Papaver atlanticum TaxID=357466 RepID=A0AAD4XRH2_9MAGN|nr:hypothetical protein MKW98_003299 [Papaver atlanticum]
MRVEMVAVVRKTLALILMKNNDYVGARKNLIDARALYPGLEYIDEMIKVCDIICSADSQGSEIDWRLVLGINKTTNEHNVWESWKCFGVEKVSGEIPAKNVNSW